jgi:hypothetical protein
MRRRIFRFHLNKHRIALVAAMLTTLVAIHKDHDTKAELNRRSQPCEVLTVARERDAALTRLEHLLAPLRNALWRDELLDGFKLNPQIRIG